MSSDPKSAGLGVPENAPLHVCLKGSKLVAECGTRFDCLNMAKKANVKKTLTAGPSVSRLEVRRHI